MHEDSSVWGLSMLHVGAFLTLADFYIFEGNISLEIYCS